MSARMMPELPNHPDLDRLLVEAQKRFDAMTPEQKKEMRAAQQKSWVVGNYMLDHPDVSRKDAEEIYEKVIQGVGL